MSYIIAGCTVEFPTPENKEVAVRILSLVHEISKFVRFPQGGGGGYHPHPRAVWNDPKILRSRYGINMVFGAQRVKMIRLQLYGSDFLNSVRKKMAAKKPVGWLPW